MPYQLQSALGAGLADAAGFMAGQTERKRYLAEQQRQADLDARAQADTEARLGLERSQQDATNAYRTSTLAETKRRTDIDAANSARADAAATAAAQKQKLLDAFRGQGLHYPKNYATMKPEQKIGYLQVRLNAAQKAGDTKTVSDTETEINRVATEAATVAKANAPPKPTWADLHPKPKAPGIRDASGLTPYEELENRRWNQTHNPNGSPKAPSRADTSGLNNAGKEAYGRDMTIWTTQGMQGPPPDPSDPKYPRRSAAGGGGGGGAAGPTRTGRSASAPGKPTLYEMSDGSWKP